MELHVTEYQVSEGVAVVTLNRPERLNAWTTRMEHEVRWCMAAADADPAARVIVVTGAGRGFCAGADMEALRGFAGGSEYDRSAPREADDFSGTFSYLLGLAKPVVAAINGPAAGVGFVLACFSDLRFAAAGVKLTTSFGRLGLPAEHGIAWVLPRIVGAARAADLLLSSRVVLAEEACEMGLVNRVAPLETTLDYARTMAAEIAPTSLRMIKRQLWSTSTLRESWQGADEATAAMIQSPEFAEGVAAFGERRPPHFS